MQVAGIALEGADKVWLSTSDGRFLSAPERRRGVESRATPPIRASLRERPRKSHLRPLGRSGSLGRPGLRRFLAAFLGPLGGISGKSPFPPGVQAIYQRISVAAVRLETDVKRRAKRRCDTRDSIPRNWKRDTVWPDIMSGQGIFPGSRSGFGAGTMVSGVVTLPPLGSASARPAWSEAVVCSKAPAVLSCWVCPAVTFRGYASPATRAT